MDLFIRTKNKILFSRYLDFCVFDKSKNLKICDVTIVMIHFRMFL